MAQAYQRRGVLGKRVALGSLVVHWLVLTIPAAAFPQALDALLSDYRLYGLPEPPKDAPLVRFESGWRTSTKDGKEITCAHLGFLLRAAGKDRPAVVLVGTEEFEIRPWIPDVQKVDPNSVSMENIRGEWMSSPFGINVGLATALQCKARGWDKLGQRLWDLSIREESGHLRSVLYLTANSPAKPALAVTAWAHYANQLVRRDTDRKVILKQMKVLIAREPKLDVDDNRGLLKCLEATIVPSAAKAGTPQALIDGLVDLHGSTSVFSFMDQMRESPARARLVEMGFEAVPVLIEHLDDPRLTRSYTAGFGNMTAHVRQVGDIVSDILQGLAGDELGRDWLDRQLGDVVAKAKAREWFDAASKLGEEAYLVKYALPKGGEGPNPQVLHVLSKKYPSHLPALYRRLFNTPVEMESRPLAELIAESPMGRKEQIDLFLSASKSAFAEHRLTAIEMLKDLDRGQFVKLVDQAIDNLPKIAKSSRWIADVHSLTWLATEAGACQSLAKAARQSDVEIRMEVIEAIGWSGGEPTERGKRLEFLAGFLSDDSVRKARERDENQQYTPAGSRFPNLEVRDFAAMTIASMLKTGDTPSKDWSTEQWAAFRARIRERLLREGVLR